MLDSDAKLRGLFDDPKKLQEQAAALLARLAHLEDAARADRPADPAVPAGDPPTAVAGDKGYSHRPIRAWLRRHKVKAVIPRRKDPRPDDGRHRFDATLYKERAAVEQCIGWLKENRAVGTRFDKLAVNFRATVQLAILRRYLRLLAKQPDSPDRA